MEITLLGSLMGAVIGLTVIAAVCAGAALIILGLVKIFEGRH